MPTSNSTQKGGETLKILIEDSTHSRLHGYPPNLIRFIVCGDNRYYDKPEYVYGFRADGTHDTAHRPSVWGPTIEEINQQSFAAFGDLLFPWRLKPPVKLKQLAAQIHATGVIDPNGAMKGSFLPVSFVATNELAIAKLSSVSDEKAEEAILQVLAEYFGISRSTLDIKFM